MSSMDHGDRQPGRRPRLEEASRPVAEAAPIATGPELNSDFAVPDDLGGAHALFLSTDAGNKTASLVVSPPRFRSM